MTSFTFIYLGVGVLFVLGWVIIAVVNSHQHNKQCGYNASMTTKHNHEWYYTGTMDTKKDENGNPLVCVHLHCHVCGREEVANVPESTWRNFDLSTLTEDEPLKQS